MNVPNTKNAPAHVMRSTGAVSKRIKDALGVPPGKPNPDIGRRELLEYISEHGPMRATDMSGAGPGHTARLVWLQKEGYAACDRAGTRSAMWDITALGRRWIEKKDGGLVPPRTLPPTPWVPLRDLTWQVRAGSDAAFALPSRGVV